MKNENQIYLFGALVLALILYQYSGFFGINLSTSNIVYFNKDINVVFTTSNFTNPSVEAYFADKQLYEVTFYETNDTLTNSTTNQTYTQARNVTIEQTIGYSKNIINGSYALKFSNIKTDGLIKVRVFEGNHSETQTIEVRKAFVDVKHNIPNVVDKSHQTTFEIKTYNPQGDNLEADSVDIEITDPLNNKQTIYLDKNGNIFTKTFYYTNAGTYQFKIHAKKEGYDTKEISAVTEVAKNEGIHPVVYIWIFFTVIWVLLFGIKMLRRFT